jgi:uncharacterized protein YceK
MRRILTVLAVVLAVSLSSGCASVTTWVEQITCKQHSLEVAPGGSGKLICTKCGKVFTVVDAK